ncbi:zinc-dependent alcohol dehydrogenase [Diplocloster hominis]|uniref:zinc-dependent alcohol dehydrogenase n=1 Tax=Diplocloster hominis TaxID=3079010 RepID=UPI0031BA80E5
MRGLIVTKEHEVRLVDDIPMPKIGEYEALVKMSCCMICNGTDREIIQGKLAEAQEYPLVLGHEGAGRVIRTGDRVRSFWPGDLVVRPCLLDAGKYRSAWGGFAEYGIVVDTQALREDGQKRAYDPCGLTQQVVPAGIRPEQASLMITLKETLSAVRRIGLSPEDNVLIVGDGPVGLCMLYNCLLSGIRNVSVLGNRPENLKRARQIGAMECYHNRKEEDHRRLEADWAGRLNCYIDTVGNQETIQQGMRLTEEDGTVAVYGLGIGDRLVLSMDGIRNRKLQFVQWPINELERETHSFIADAVLSGRIDTDLLITHVLPIEDYKKGFEAIQNKEAVKVALTFSCS